MFYVMKFKNVGVITLSFRLVSILVSVSASQLIVYCDDPCACVSNAVYAVCLPQCAIVIADAALRLD